jgi:hypothetical protein
MRQTIVIGVYRIRKQCQERARDRTRRSAASDNYDDGNDDDDDADSPDISFGAAQCCGPLDCGLCVLMHDDRYILVHIRPWHAQHRGTTTATLHQLSKSNLQSLQVTKGTLPKPQLVTQR